MESSAGKYVLRELTMRVFSLRTWEDFASLLVARASDNCSCEGSECHLAPQKVKGTTVYVRTTGWTSRSKQGHPTYSVGWYQLINAILFAPLDHGYHFDSAGYDESQQCKLSLGAGLAPLYSGMGQGLGSDSGSQFGTRPTSPSTK